MTKHFIKNTILILLLICGIISNSEARTSDTTLIYTYTIDDEISKAAVRRTQKAMKEANELKADIIILRLNTCGGLLVAADSIRTAILNSKIPFWVFIDNNAASAGALISIAADSIFMREGANMGAATVVDQKGDKVPDKYQSYMRSLMRSTAEAKGRNPDIAQAMVDEDVEVKGISEKGEVLTLTAYEALKINYCDAITENMDEILEFANIKQYKIVHQEIKAMDSVIEFLTSSIVSGILIMMIIGGIYLEFQSPGAIFPIVIAAVGALLYFAPLYIEGLAANWEIVIFVIGVILLVIEIFAFPGFGVFGISGITLMVAGLAFAMIDNFYFKFPVNASIQIFKAFAIVIIASFTSIVLSFFIAKKLFGGKTIFGTLSLSEEQNKDFGYYSAPKNTETLIGKTGIAYTDLRPSGKIKVGNEIIDATAMVGYIEKNEQVKIVSYSHAQYMVTKVKTNNNTETDSENL